jgi:hypothetical protein
LKSWHRHQVWMKHEWTVLQRQTWQALLVRLCS